jgi:hypothetical protein
MLCFGHYSANLENPTGHLGVFHETPNTIPEDHTTLLSFLHVFSMWVLQDAVSQMKSFLLGTGNFTHHSHKTR